MVGIVFGIEVFIGRRQREYNGLGRGVRRVAGAATVRHPRGIERAENVRLFG